MFYVSSWKEACVKLMNVSHLRWFLVELFNNMPNICAKIFAMSKYSIIVEYGHETCVPHTEKTSLNHESLSFVLLLSHRKTLI